MVKVFVPSDINSHPYLILLYSSLSKYARIIDVKNKKDAFRKLKFLTKVEIIHLHWLEHFVIGKNIIFTILKLLLFLSSLSLLKFLRKKIVITLHNIGPHEEKYVTLSKLGFKISLKLADAIIVHNKWSKKEAIRTHRVEKEKIHVIPHGNFVEFYPNNISKEEARRILGIPNSSFVILYLGKIRKYKGLDRLISAFNDIRSDDVWILICGKVEDEKIKEDLLNFAKNFKKCILRLEYIPDEDIQIYMNASDIGILPYEKITTSGSLFLFASFKRTVIAPKLEPINEIIGKAAIYYERSHASNIKEAILKAKNTNLIKLSNEVYRLILKYKWDEIARETLQLYLK